MIQLYHPMAYRATPSPFPHPRIFLASHVSLPPPAASDRKSTRLNSSHLVISYAVFCLKKKTLTTSFSLTFNNFILSVYSFLPFSHKAVGYYYSNILIALYFSALYAHRALVSTLTIRI